MCLFILMHFWSVAISSLLSEAEEMLAAEKPENASISITC